MLQGSLLLLTFLLPDSGSPAGVHIHDVPIVPAAAVISDVYNDPAVVGLVACRRRLHYFCKPP
jgi:hypothetical protein